MKTYLFFFTIGPVQGFIAQARKTHDLFAGSKLLSDLCNSGIISAEKNGCKIILPEPGGDKKPNRFVAKIESNNENKLRSLGEIVEKAVRDELKKHIPNEITNINSAQKQVNNLLDVHWLFLPVENNNYADTYNKCENMLGAIKNLRRFEQMENNGEKGRKCIVDGERNVVVYRKSDTDQSNSDGVRKTKLFIDDQEEVLIVAKQDEKTIPVWHLQPGEGISAVTYLKRKYENDPHKFPSTAAISLMHIKDKFTNEYMAYEKLIKSFFLHSNDQLFYEENLDESFLKKQPLRNGKDLNAAKNNLMDSLGKLKDKVKADATNLKFLKYYAIISFDGDSMGEWFSGDNLQDKNQLEDFHRDLAKNLQGFSKEASDYLDKEKYNGMTVYAGEDFLGFINLPRIFEVLKQLKDLWDKHINRNLSNKYTFKPNKKFTFSAGIAIAHYKQPLSIVLKQVRKAASQSKNSGKNSFTVMAMKHSGTALQCTYSFSNDAMQKIKFIIEQLGTNFSSAFIMKFITGLIHLGEKLPVTIVKPELEKNIKRANKVEKLDDESDEDFKIRKSQFNDAMISAVTDLLNLNISNGEIESSGNFIQTLSICDFLERRVS